jgi:hypothetical protein
MISTGPRTCATHGPDPLGLAGMAENTDAEPVECTEVNARE